MSSSKKFLEEINFLKEKLEQEGCGEGLTDSMFDLLERIYDHMVEVKEAAQKQHNEMNEKYNGLIEFILKKKEYIDVLSGEEKKKIKSLMIKHNN